MHYWVSFAGLAAILALSYVMGRNRAQALSIGSALHSLPGHYGAYTLIWAMVPAIALMIGWAFIQPAILESMIIDAIPADRFDALDELNQDALINSIKGYAAGLKSDDGMVQSIGRQLNGWTSTGNTAMVITVVLISLAGFLIGRSRVVADLRARNLVEGFVMMVLLAASTVAIFTTVGIVLSLLFDPTFTDYQLVMRLTLPVALVTAPFAPVVFFVLNRIDNLFVRKQATLFQR